MTNPTSAAIVGLETSNSVGANKRPGRKSRRRLSVLIVFAVLVCVAGAAVHQFRESMTGPRLPTAVARSGEFLTVVRCRGELRARRSAQIVAPADVPELRIVWLAPAGQVIEAGSPAVRFDPSSAQQQLAEKQAALDQAQATLDQAEAEANITAAQDRLELANARYEVERAKLEVSKSEIISAMQAEQSRIALKLADEKLSVQQATIRLHEASATSKISSVTRTRDEAQAEVELTEYRLSQMEIAAPIGGMIIFLENRSQGWLNAQPFKVGDQVWRGASIAEIPDLATLEFEGKIEEIDRGAIHAGDEVRVRVDALPELTVNGDLTGITPLTQPGFEFPPTRSFRGYAPLQDLDPRLRPGMIGSMDVIVDRIPNAVIVPSQAVFSRDGKPVVYVEEGDSYRPAEIEVVGRNPDEFAISGVEPQVTVALIEPEKPT